jgi:hypothetical protein
VGGQKYFFGFEDAQPAPTLPLDRDSFEGKALGSNKVKSLNVDFVVSTGEKLGKGCIKSHIFI